MMYSSMRLTPSTILGKEELRKIKTILQCIIDRKDAYDFLTPVDWKALGLTDYTFIIKNPMDLGTINNKLKEDKYRYVEEALDDIQLVWDNCKLYNQPQTWIYKTAESLERSFKKMVKNYLPSIPIVIPGRQSGTSKNQQKKPVQINQFEEEQNEDQVTYHEKLKFSEKLKHLTCEQLGIIVDLIMSKCPEAFHEEDNENAQLIVDNIDFKTFQEVSEMVRQMNEQYEDKLIKKVKV